MYGAALVVKMAFLEVDGCGRHMSLAKRNSLVMW
jgi:hypothetical protein